MATRVVDRDRGYRELMKRVKREKLTLTVGVHDAEGGEDHGDLTVAEVAAFHEFGLGDNPERSFLRATVDENVDEHKKVLGDIGRAVVQGQYTTEQGLERFGLLVEAQVKKRISDGIDPPLSPETIRRKASSTPLIDTGQLRSSITHQMKKGGGA